MSPRAKYTALRWVLVRLRRISVRYAINFDNAAESARKDVVLPRAGGNGLEGE